MDNMKRMELTLSAFKESMAQKVVSYEEQVATIRAEASLLIEESNKRIAQLEEQLNQFRKDREDVAVQEDSPDSGNS